MQTSVAPVVVGAAAGRERVLGALLVRGEAAAPTGWEVNAGRVAPARGLPWCRSGRWPRMGAEVLVCFRGEAAAPTRG